MHVKEINGQRFVEKLAERLKSEISMPEWARFVKTGSHVERPPHQEDWWYLRAASIFRKIYLDGPVGVEKLRTFYGKKRDRGHKPSHFRKAGGKIIRTILQQLEEKGWLAKEKKGRVLTPEGRRYLDRFAKEAFP